MRVNVQRATQQRWSNERGSQVRASSPRVTAPHTPRMLSCSSPNWGSGRRPVTKTRSEPGGPAQSPGVHGELDGAPNKPAFRNLTLWRQDADRPRARVAHPRRIRPTTRGRPSAGWKVSWPPRAPAPARVALAAQGPAPKTPIVTVPFSRETNQSSQIRDPFLPQLRRTFTLRCRSIDNVGGTPRGRGRSTLGARSCALGVSCAMSAAPQLASKFALALKLSRVLDLSLC
jgi:hypothetical protein